jgi:hypothetical protein
MVVAKTNSKWDLSGFPIHNEFIGARSLPTRRHMLNTTVPLIRARARADELAAHACGHAGGWVGGPRVRAGRDDPKPGCKIRKKLKF